MHATKRAPATPDASKRVLRATCERKSAFPVNDGDHGAKFDEVALARAHSIDHAIVRCFDFNVDFVGFHFEQRLPFLTSVPAVFSQDSYFVAFIARSQAWNDHIPFMLEPRVTGLRSYRPKS